jgi:hypothetical protein
MNLQRGMDICSLLSLFMGEILHYYKKYVYTTLKQYEKSTKTSVKSHILGLNPVIFLNKIVLCPIQRADSIVNMRRSLFKGRKISVWKNRQIKDVWTHTCMVDK